MNLSRSPFEAPSGPQSASGRLDCGPTGARAICDLLNLENTRVLVTGAGGFIGSHLVERLVGLGAEVAAFVRYNSRADWGLIRLLPAETQKKIQVFSGDIRDPNAVSGAMEGVGLVFHLAASISIPYSYVNPREVIETNIMGTFNVLSAARMQRVSRVIHLSSSEVYGTARYVPIDEAHPLQGQSPYSASKIGADQIAESFWRSFGVPVVTIRPFNTYGPRQSMRAVVPTIIVQALERAEIRLGSIHPTRDFTFVLDTVDALIRAAECAQVEGQVINVGSGFEISVGDLVAQILHILGREAQVVQEERRMRPQASEVERLWADNSKARKLLGWAPTVSLENGLEETIEWIRAHRQLYAPDEYKV